MAQGNPTHNKITGANAGGPRQSQVERAGPARFAQFCRSAQNILL